ncbi:class I SAM-dependent methyltransferase [Shewanella sp. VB17]|uniref:class I SAM-dependent methyltransferase n=1 Tax=Shewanella sp. VB17 TaxID=2739432 RepID=UPI0015660296|nr:class I SAM-dependent methyltransferase [Shewanella sp. VB17]NRD73046.1 class I SAM-dependent methyltransferase [Shewanella sp. VB17]
MSEWDNIAEEVDFNLEISIEDFVTTGSKRNKVLDFGCGYGRITNQLNQLGYSHLIGVDSSMEMIKRGLNEYPYLDLRPISDSILPFPDHEFDSIITCAVFTCIPSQYARKKLLKELRRVLQPNGVLYLAEFCSDKSLRFTSGAGVPMWHSQQSELEGMLDGFNIELSKAVESSTMSGILSNASHIIARKII